MCFTQGFKDGMCGGKFVDRVIVMHGDVSEKATFERIVVGLPDMAGFGMCGGIGWW